MTKCNHVWGFDNNECIHCKINPKEAYKQLQDENIKLKEQFKKRKDLLFKRMTDVMFDFIYKHDTSLDEMIEACKQACIRYEMEVGRYRSFD